MQIRLGKFAKLFALENVMHCSNLTSTLVLDYLRFFSYTIKMA